jgi:hypothetical protein
MLNTISRAPPPISRTASHALDVACFILEKLEDLWAQGLVSIGVQSLAMMQTNLLPDILIVVLILYVEFLYFIC